MLNSLPFRLLWRSLNWLTRLAIVAAVLIALFVIMLRYWLLPGIEQYHDRITASLSAAIGNPVTIGKIEGDWQGLRPRLDFKDVRILDERRHPALVLPHIDSSVSWMSLFTGQLRLASLEIDKPELLVQRDTQGKISIGGVAFSKSGGDSNIADWLLHQSHMVVHDALIIWMDEQRDATPLVLRQVNLRIENSRSHHRFALRAIPPEELGMPLDVRGDFQGVSFDNPETWRGQLFTQFDFRDVSAWRHWLDIPKEFSSGRGALRGWLGVEQGRLTGMTADLALYNVAAKLSEDVPEMQLVNLRGRVTWRQEQGGFAVSTNGLMLRLQDGLELQPTDFYFRSVAAVNEQPANIQMRTNVFQLETITKLSAYLPLEAGLRARLEAYAPSGKVTGLDMRWQGAIEKPASYAIKGKFEKITMHQVGKMPGFSGLTMDINGTDASGMVNINSLQMRVDAPGVIREPLSFDTVTGQVGWRHKDGEMLVNIDKAIVINDDLAGTLQGSYQTRKGTLGILDLAANLTRGDIRRAARYTPLIALGKEGGDWLSGALLAGHTEDFNLRIKGNLSDFPPDNTHKVQFEIGGHARNAVLEFAKDWPRIENITGEFRISGNRLEVIAPSATMAGAYLQNIDVTIPDMISINPALEVKGEASASSSTFLKFVQVSPVRGYIEGFTDGMRASGNSRLSLSLRLPLAGSEPVQVSGNLQVKDNDIDLGKGALWLRNTHGTLSFTESGMQANGVTAEILGGPATLNLQSGSGGKVHVAASGNCNLDIFRKKEPHSWLNYFRGGTAWDAGIDLTGKAAQIVFNSNLQGLSSSMPEPFSKRANETMPLHIERKSLHPEDVNGPEAISVRLGSVVEAHLVAGDQDGVSVIKYGTINFGGAGKSPSGNRQSRKGIWLAGRLPELTVQGWGDLAGGSGMSIHAFPVSGASLTIDKLTGYGKRIDALRLAVARRGDGLAAKLSGEGVNGELVWLPHGYKKLGKLSVRMRNMQLRQDDKPAEKATPANASAKVESSSSFNPGNMPALDIAVDNLLLNGKQIGRFELVGFPDGADWRLRRLDISNPDGSLTGDGAWLGNPVKSQSQINLQLQISDVGKVLDRSGYPNTVKGGSGKLNASFSWAGRPDEFNYATLNGTINVNTGKGRFLKMDQGAGKLLSLLSLQYLPNNIVSGFSDVFSAGFQFDNIIGDASINNGVMATRELHIYGPAAKVAMKGSVDLNHETQNLSVKVFPAIGDSVSLLAVFAINPAVGIGSLIANTVLGGPLDKLVSFEYNITGTWSEPNVARVGGAPAKAIENNLNE